MMVYNILTIKLKTKMEINNRLKKYNKKSNLEGTFTKKK